MAFDFSSIKNDHKDKTKLLAQKAKLGALQEEIKNLRKPALERNDWGAVVLLLLPG